MTGQHYKNNNAVKVAMCSWLRYFSTASDFYVRTALAEMRGSFRRFCRKVIGHVWILLTVSGFFLCTFVLVYNKCAHDFGTPFFSDH